MGSVVGSIAGPLIGGLIGSASGGASSNTPKPYVPPNQGQAASTYLNALNAQAPLQSWPQQGAAYQSVANQQYNNPGTSLYQQGAAGAGQMLQPTAQNLFGASQAVNAYAPQIGAAGQSVFNMGMDPQQALYNRTAQQLQDQIRAGESARGIAMSPYGAGLENQGMSNFNIDWQNQQLNRANTGLQALQGAGQSMEQMYGAAGGLGEGASQDYLTAAGLPYKTNAAILGDRYGALSGYDAALARARAGYGDVMQGAQAYMGLGQNAYNNQLAAAQQAGQQQQNLGQAFGPAIGAGAQALYNSIFPTTAGGGGGGGGGSSTSWFNPFG